VPNATEELLAELSRRKHEPLLHNVSGTLKLDLHRSGRTEQWFLTIRRGDIEVTRRSRKADCRLRVDADLFNKIAAGEANALAAMLRGALAVDGDLELMMLFQRLLPGRRAAKAMVREGTPPQ
jgi:putative sterol carrier protein